MRVSPFTEVVSPVSAVQTAEIQHTLVVVVQPGAPQLRCQQTRHVLKPCFAGPSPGYEPGALGMGGDGSGLEVVSRRRHRYRHRRRCRRRRRHRLSCFMEHLYTTPPVSAENMQHLLGPQVMEGWSATERKRVERNFAVFKQAQEREEQRRAKKAKGSK